MTLLRTLLGDALRRRRHEQDRTLHDVSSTARVSLAYLSEVERGRKEPSSELLAAICRSLQVPLSEVIQEVGDRLAASEQAAGALVPEVPAAEPAAASATEAAATVPVVLSSRRSHREPVARAAA